MEIEELVARWRQEEEAPFQGWDFSYLQGRMIEPQMPWDYLALARKLMPGATAVLDMGTGGGERLLGLRDVWPAAVTVTEGWPPNVALARTRLEPWGVRVVAAQHGGSAYLPFADASFDLVLNRHTGFRVEEVARVLRPGGVFLTQQVDALWGQDLKQAFGVVVEQRPSSFSIVLHYLTSATDLSLETAESYAGTFTFTDVGALVYHLKHVPWTVPNFSVDTHLPYLLQLQEKLTHGQPLKFQTRYYLLQARKP